MWPFNLSVRLPIVALVGRYPANWLIGRESIFQRIAPLINLSCDNLMLCGISVLFRTLSPSERQVAHVLLTRPPLSLLSFSRRIIPTSSVRLACVRRAASVRPEPGSNSLIMVSKAFRLQIFSKVLPAKFPLLVSLLYPEILKFFSRVIPPKLPSWVPRFSSLVVHFSRCWPLSHTGHFCRYARDSFCIIP